MNSSTGRIAGIDYGTKRIGIAISDANRTLASPLENYNRQSEVADRARFQKLVKVEDVALFVVGLPVHLDGNESGKSIEARRFGEWLAAATGVSVEFFDERFTSYEAEQYLMGAELSKKKRKARLDMLAAQIMLTAYLESKAAGRAGPDQPPRGLDD